MLASGIVYEDNWMRLRRDEIERRDGSRGTYAFVEKSDFALVIPAENDGFHMVEEFRYPIGRRTWSFPQGGFPPGAAGRPEELARLEHAQETGFRARHRSSSGTCTARTASAVRAATSSWPPGWNPGRLSGSTKSRTCARPGCPGPGSRR
jgi:hypothetical protein